MALIYYDRSVDTTNTQYHPAAVIDLEHPCYKMVREAIDGKSVFHWTREQAYTMYVWYVESWNGTDIYTEFGELVYSSDFKEVIKTSHYLVEDPDGRKKGLVPSRETIEALYAAVEMEKKMLASNGDDEDEET